MELCQNCQDLVEETNEAYCKSTNTNMFICDKCMEDEEFFVEIL